LFKELEDVKHDKWNFIFDVQELYILEAKKERNGTFYSTSLKSDKKLLSPPCKKNGENKTRIVFYKNELQIQLA